MSEQAALGMDFNEALARIANRRPKLEELPTGEARPFIKWAGGKRSLMAKLLAAMPKQYGKYHEPFIGGGALFFAAKPKAALIADINLDLVITYGIIQKNPAALIAKLKQHKAKHNEDYYYRIRKQFVLTDAVEIAARFIYLNKTCYNGLYRVNAKGEFNVPMGSYTNPLIVDELTIMACHEALKGVEVRYLDFTKVEPAKGDFIYLDPPYHPVDDTSFTKYTKADFNEADQLRLFEYCEALDKKGVKFLLSNSDTRFIQNLYKGYTIESVEAPRNINCKPGRRQGAKEVLVRNY